MRRAIQLGIGAGIIAAAIAAGVFVWAHHDTPLPTTETELRVCDVGKPTIADPTKDEQVLGALYGKVVRMRDQYVPNDTYLAAFGSPPFADSKLRSDWDDSLQTVAARKNTQLEGRKVWLVILESAQVEPVESDDQSAATETADTSPQPQTCHGCGRQAGMVILRQCRPAGGSNAKPVWQADGSMQALSAGGSHGYGSGFEFVSLGPQRPAIVQRSGSSGQGITLETMDLYAWDKERLKKVLTLPLSYEESGTGQCGQDAEMRGSGPTPCRELENRLLPVSPAEGDWWPLSVSSRWVADKSGEHKRTYHLVYRNGHYQPASGKWPLALQQWG
jgi:hypothetical protein